MSTDYFSDQEAFITGQPLPSPAGTPYTSSQRNSNYDALDSEIASSPPPLPSNPYPETEDETANNESISILDPRRFTPTLHANLVSEILNLRRELDSKHRFIEDVESNLHTARTENDSLMKQLSSSAKDNRTAKRQLQHFENEMLAALEEIAGERDKLKDTNADLKSKLEAAEKRSRSQGDDSTRVHDMWAREKEVWAGEKRTLERKVHISEARLKLLLDELAANEAVREETRVETEAEDAKDINTGAESDTASVRSSPQRFSSTHAGRHSRNASNSSYRSIGRNYRMSLLSNEGQGRGIGLSLADELIFDEEEEDLDELELDSDDFPENEMRARRVMESRQSMYPDDKAKRILGLSSDVQQSNKDPLTSAEEYGSVKTSYETTHSAVTMTPRDITLIFPPTKPIYVDTGVQPSPPASPVLPAMTEASSQTIDESSVQHKPVESSATRTESDANQSQANQRRKRTSLLLESPNPSRSASPILSAMTSSGVQTLEQPLSPPPTPKITIPNAELPETPVSPDFKTELVSSSTQTESSEKLETLMIENKRSAPPASILIPSIAIYAPDSLPSSPKDARLPPGTKTIATQTTSDLIAPLRSFGMQTDPIRVDQRPVKLPPHLLPSAISSKPGTPETKQDLRYVGTAKTEQPPPKPAARKDLLALLEKAATVKVENRYPGNNDNGPLSNNYMAEPLTRPFRTSSLFAGFEGPSSDEEEFASDDERRGHAQVMLSSRNAKSGRPVNPPTPVPEDKEPAPIAKISEETLPPGRLSSERASLEKAARITKRNSLSRQPSIRRSAMIQSGTSAHANPAMSSVGTSTHIKPPFPVPMRSSSRNMPLSKSEGSTSPTPGSGNTYASRRMHATKHQRKDSLRKVRSAAPVSRTGRSRSRSPTMPATPSIPDTNSIPPLPSDIMSASGFGHRHQLSTNTAYTANQSVASSNSQANVVDAIAAAMIGEFMWKYVRRRKAFGGVEAPVDRAAEEASLASGGVRHRRWVWISPYERAILWSSKQPTSGSALMGKSGRKRKYPVLSPTAAVTDNNIVTIQSVLDVADNSPVQKNETLFNRSILILTPARALKFTTVSRERHYLWLTALSFLAHSSAPMPDLGAMPQPPPVEDLPQRSTGATLRRSRVQDSVRLAKGRNPVMQRYAAQAESTPGLPSLAGFERPIPESASPPSIPRGPAHGRKRSSTGPGAPPPSVPFRSFSHQQVPSVYSNGSSDKYSAMQPPSVPSSVYNPSGVVSSRTSEASTSARSHFFDAMGTVRMEAFIDDALGDPAQRQNLYVKPRGARHRRSSQWSDSARERPLRAAGLYDDADNDIFRGF